jgi:hypothetical protein
MKQDTTKHRLQKWYASEQQEEQLEAHCEANGVSKSEFVRAIVMRALRPQAHRIRRGPRREGPKLVPIADIFPSRRGGAPVPLRL